MPEPLPLWLSLSQLTFLPDLPTLAGYTLAAFVLAITPGPDMALFLARTVSGGKQAGFAAMLGASTGMMGHALLAGFGLSALLAASTTAFSIVKGVGALYLVFLAYQAIRYGSGLTADPQQAESQSFFRTWLTGLGVNLTNPKVVMFFVTFLPQFVDPADPHAADKIVFLGMFFLVVGVPVSVFIIMTAERFSAFLRSSPALMRRFDYSFAGIMSVFALKLLFTQGR